MAKQAAHTNSPKAHAVGRRKNAVARVWFRKGTGTILVNNKKIKDYFDTEITYQNATSPIRIVPVSASYDVQITVEGGGKVSQSDAIKLAISRAFVSLDESIRPDLRKHGLLTVDARVKERKKYGQRGARRKFQFVKR